MCVCVCCVCLCVCVTETEGKRDRQRERERERERGSCLVQEFQSEGLDKEGGASVCVCVRMCADVCAHVSV